MKKPYKFRRTLSAMLLLMMSSLTWAYDFEVDGIYYNFLDEESAEVTYGALSGEDYSRDIVIPSAVTYDNKTYSVTRIGNQALRSRTSLTSISIPESVTSIGYDAFSGCSSLTSISLPESVTSIGQSAFYKCSSLTSISLPESVTSIEVFAFQYCSSLTSISIPKSVTSIGQSAFYYCTSLTSISIPEGVTSIGNKAFYGCTSLTSVICYAENIPVLGSSVFYNVSINEATLYVPASALEDYKAAKQWKDFGTILPLEDIPAGISNIEADDSNAPYYTLDGMKVYNPTQKGIYIKNSKKILIK